MPIPSAIPGFPTAGTTPAHWVETARLPILMYHRVSAIGSPGLCRYRVAPEPFEEQLRYLRQAGFRSVRLDEWRAARTARRPLPGRRLLLTFDDGYRDFLTCAWPALKRHGFTALVFLVAGEIGGWNGWDSAYGERVPLLDWDEIAQLQAEGVEFGSHSLTHPHLTSLSQEEVLYEGWRSRVVLQGRLRRSVTAFAYPYGDINSVVRQLIGACGYTCGLTCRPGSSTFDDLLLDLPRIEVTNSHWLEISAARLGTPRVEAASLAAEGSIPP